MPAYIYVSKINTVYIYIYTYTNYTNKKIYMSVIPCVYRYQISFMHEGPWVATNI